VSSASAPILTPIDPSRPQTIANALGTAALKGKMYARVSMTLYYDAGRTGQDKYGLGILTPKPVTNVTCSSARYAVTIGSGHFLNPHTKNNVIIVQHLDPDAGVAANIVQFDLVLDGKLLATETDGVLYVFAISSDGPHIFNNPGHTLGDGTVIEANDTETFHGFRSDLHAGNEADSADTTYPDRDRWLRSRVEDVDIQIVGKSLTTAPRGKEGKKSAKFS
jgi:hypothetical protein